MKMTYYGFPEEYIWKKDIDFCGDKYDKNMTIKEISKLIEVYISEKYGEYKFSITIEDADIIRVVFTEVPFEKITEYLNTVDYIKEIQCVLIDIQNFALRYNYFKYTNELCAIQRKFICSTLVL